MKGRNAQAGFTFIELMAVVAIIGTLAALTMPSIKNYVARAKISEAIIALTNCRTTVAEVYQSGSNFPAAGSWGCESATGSKYVEHITTLEGGVISVRTSGAMGDLRIAVKDITMAPLNRSGQVMNEDDLSTPVFRWRCGSTIDGTDSTLDVTFLPSTCRGI
jgi:type IV pilus assembly protein PilA